MNNSSQGVNEKLQNDRRRREKEGVSKGKRLRGKDQALVEGKERKCEKSMNRKIAKKIS
jgi:hypothetical protein